MAHILLGAATIVDGLAVASVGSRAASAATFTVANLIAADTGSVRCSTSASLATSQCDHRCPKQDSRLLWRD